MLWVMEKADGIHLRISRADWSPTWVWQRQPRVRAHQTCQWQADSCRAISRLCIQFPCMPSKRCHRAGPRLLGCASAKENMPSWSSQGRKKCLRPRGYMVCAPSSIFTKELQFPIFQHSSWKDGYRSHHIIFCQVKQSCFTPFQENLLWFHSYHSQPQQVPQWAASH